MLSVEETRSFGHGPLPGMGSLDEELSAMLQSGHAMLSQASLAGVMAPDVFSSHAAPYPGALAPASGLARASSMSSAGLPQSARPRPHPNSRIRPPQRQWARDAKWTLDAQGEVLDMHAPFSAGFDVPVMSSPAAPAPGGLHRYHSAPSALLQAIADEAFSQIPPSPPTPLFSEGGLTSITEVMDVERMGSGDSVTEFEQFLLPDSDFSQRAAMSALQVKSENAETFSSLFPPAKLVRQNSVPVEGQHSEQSISETSEDASLVSGGVVTSPGTPGGKRSRGELSAWESETTSGLIRHASLPSPAGHDELQLVQTRARAKRGCATHPRSIAERVRRTRISERMKKLQDLVPNMEKTTSTSDMLDETVLYVKSLQFQVRELQDTVAQLKAAAAVATATSTVAAAPPRTPTAHEP